MKVSSSIHPRKRRPHLAKRRFQSNALKMLDKESGDSHSPSKLFRADHAIEHFPVSPKNS
jgi:hypothetical protein